MKRPVWLFSACRLNFAMLCSALVLGITCSSYASGPVFPEPDAPRTATSPAPASELTALMAADTNSAANPSRTSVNDATGLATNAAPDIYTNGMESLDDKYPLAVGDTINFQIKEDNDDPQTIEVTDSGDIEVPYIGRFPAAGKTCKELAGQLKEALEKKYYYRATVIISVKSMASQGVVYVVGGVKAPGPLEIPRDDILTVSKAILRAGGFDDFADEKKVRLTRRTDGGTNEVLTVNVEAVLNKGEMQDDPRVQSGDLIFVPEKAVRF